MKKRKHKIEFTVACTEQEHKKAWFTVQFRCGILQFWWIVFLVSLLFLSSAYMLFSKQAMDLLLVGIAFCVLAIGLPVVYFTIAILNVKKRRRHYLDKYMAIGERTLTVFSHSISITSKMVSTDIPFSDCIFFIEKKDFFILVQSRRGYLIIPKRDVPINEMDELKKRLKHGSLWYRLTHHRG